MTRIIEAIGEPVVVILIIAGALFCLISSFGIVRMPDYYTRSHASSKATTLGVLLVLLGAFLFFIFDSGHADAKLLLGIVFVFITSPVSNHLISRAAYRTGVKLWEKSKEDELYRLIHRPSQDPGNKQQ